ncbi:unnamed protein product [Lactuca saligna]|uniref:Uncharacterized protein n=1 Tax=Lactuca saligna TaxID=75948 RepID=A0AA35ZSH2_LACSI|nr:unnamed protein product [Lactuca saligna]
MVFNIVGFENGKTVARARTHGSSIDPNPQKDVAGPSRKAVGKRNKGGEEGSDPSLTNDEIKPIAPTFGVAQSGRQNSTIESFFLDKCNSIRQRTTGEIFIVGLITIIGRFVGLDFLAPEYILVNAPPNFLLDCDALIRMEMLLDRGTCMYSWLDSDRTAVYILPSWIGSSFDTDDPDTWLPPDQLTQAGVFPEFGDEEGEDTEEPEEEDDKKDDEMPEAEDHFDQPSM